MAAKYMSIHSAGRYCAATTVAKRHRETHPRSPDFRDIGPRIAMKNRYNTTNANDASNNVDVELVSNNTRRLCTCRDLNVRLSDVLDDPNGDV